VHSYNIKTVLMLCLYVGEICTESQFIWLCLVALRAVQ